MLQNWGIHQKCCKIHIFCDTPPMNFCNFKTIFIANFKVQNFEMFLSSQLKSFNIHLLTSELQNFDFFFNLLHCWLPTTTPHKLAGMHYRAQWPICTIHATCYIIWHIITNITTSISTGHLISFSKAWCYQYQVL